MNIRKWYNNAVLGHKSGVFKTWPGLQRDPSSDPDSDWQPMSKDWAPQSTIIFKKSLYSQQKLDALLDPTLSGISVKVSITSSMNFKQTYNNNNVFYSSLVRLTDVLGVSLSYSRSCTQRLYVDLSRDKWFIDCTIVMYRGENLTSKQSSFRFTLSELA